MHAMRDVTRRALYHTPPFLPLLSLSTSPRAAGTWRQGQGEGQGEEEQGRHCAPIPRVGELLLM